MADLYWFPIYFEKWLASVAIATMTPAERGAFFHLLCHSMAAATLENPPSVPTDPHMLGQLSGLGKRWPRSATKILKQFKEKDGRLQNPFLVKTWEKQRVNHASAVKRGKRGAEKRYGKKGSPAIAQLPGHAGKNGSSASSSAMVPEVVQLKHIELELEKELEPVPYGTRVLASFDASAVPAPNAPDAPRATPEPIPGEPSPIYDRDQLHADYVVALNLHVNAWIRENPDAWAAVDVEARRYIRAELNVPLGKLLSLSHRERVLVIVQRRTNFDDADTWVGKRVAAIKADT